MPDLLTTRGPSCEEPEECIGPCRIKGQCGARSLLIFEELEEGAPDGRLPVAHAPASRAGPFLAAGGPIPAVSLLSDLVFVPHATRCGPLGPNAGRDTVQGGLVAQVQHIGLAVGRHAVRLKVRPRQQRPIGQSGLGVDQEPLAGQVLHGQGALHLAALLDGVGHAAGDDAADGSPQQVIGGEGRAMPQGRDVDFGDRPALAEHAAEVDAARLDVGGDLGTLDIVRVQSVLVAADFHGEGDHRVVGAFGGGRAVTNPQVIVTEP